MTRIAIIADSHFDLSSRFEECIRVHQWIAEDVACRGVDLVLHAGDVFERRSNPEERRAVAEWLTAMAATAPVIVVRGNHDALGDLSIFSRLRTKHRVIVEEACGVHVVAGVAVGCLAWPRKAQLLAMTGASTVEHGEADARDALVNVLRGLGAEFAAHDGPRVLLAHAMVRGSMTSTGQPLVGCDMEIGLEDLSLAGADFIALGHIHMPQAWDSILGDASAVYPGSPRRTAFGEVEEKGYVIAEIDESRLAFTADAPRSARVTWERVATPCAPMLLVSGMYEPEVGEVCVHGLSMPTRESAPGAEIRFRYETPADAREAAKRCAAGWRERWLEYGAAAVKLEEVVIASTRARSPEVAEARTTWAQLEAYWPARSDAPAEERRAELRAKLTTIEGAAA